MQDHQLVQALVQIGDIAREAGLLAVNDLVQLPALLARIPSPVCQTAMRRSRTHDGGGASPCAPLAALATEVRSVDGHGTWRTAQGRLVNASTPWRHHPSIPTTRWTRSRVMATPPRFQTSTADHLWLQMRTRYSSTTITVRPLDQSSSSVPPKSESASGTKPTRAPPERRPRRRPGRPRRRYRGEERVRRDRAAPVLDARLVRDPVKGEPPGQLPNNPTRAVVSLMESRSRLRSLPVRATHWIRRPHPICKDSGWVVRRAHDRPAP